MTKPAVLFRAQKHWIQAAGCAVRAVSAFAITAIVLKLLLPALIPMKDPVMVGVATFHDVILVLLAAWLLLLETSNAIQSLTAEIVLLEDRVIVSWGFLSRHEVTTYLRKIESVRVDRGPLQRLLGIGNATLVGTGGACNDFFNARDIEALTVRLERQIAKMAAAPEAHAA